MKSKHANGHSHRGHHHAEESASNGTATAETASADADGAAAADGSAAEAPASTPATQRAEQMVDEFAAQVGRATAAAGHALLRWSARAREEAEDMWAEAQAIRRGR